MGKRWVQIDGAPVAKQKTKQRYTRDEVEQIIRKAAVAAGLDEAKNGPAISRVLPGQSRPVAKSAAQIERERAERQADLETTMEAERAARVAKMRDGGDRLSRTLARDAEPARAGLTFAQPDGGETSYDSAGAVTRLDLSPQPVAKRDRQLFADVVEAPATEPYTYRRRRR
jgi:hypothetical protein